MFLICACIKIIVLRINKFINLDYHNILSNLYIIIVIMIKDTLDYRDRKLNGLHGCINIDKE